MTGKDVKKAQRAPKAKTRVDTERSLMIAANIARELEKRRTELQMTQIEFARKLELSPSGYRLLLNHEANPSLVIIDKISTKSGIPLIKLLFGEASERL